MTKFIGTSGADTADALQGILLGFSGGTLARLQDEKPDIFNCGAGDDTVVLSNAAGHVVRGGSGQDTITGGAENDILYGDNDADVIHGGDGIDTIEGGAGVDQLFGGLSDDVFVVRNGQEIDDIFGGGEWFTEVNTLQLVFVTTTNATVDLTAGTWQLGSLLGGIRTLDQVHWVSGTERADLLSGSSVDDTLVGNGGNDTLHGLDGADHLIGVNGNDFLSGADGDDVLQGGSGRDTIDGGSGDDAIQGGGARDNMVGGSGDDVIEGEDGADIIKGGRGSDTLYGGTESDRMDGGQDTDYLDGGAGNDTLTGGEGADYFLMNDPIGILNADTIRDFEQGIDKIGIRSGTSSFIFAAIGEGLDADEVANGAAQDGNDFILYDSATGTVSYDADGNGAQQAVAFAILATRPASLGVGDFVVDFVIPP